VATALTAAGGRDVLVLGANVVDQCLGAGLVDEILMQLVPELVGDGVRLFDVSTLRASLTTLDVSTSGQPVNLRLRVDNAVPCGLRSLLGSLTSTAPNEEVA
jgi:dihydrofolate reductase